MQKLFTFFAFLFLSMTLLCAQTGPIIVQQGNSSWTYPDINTAIDQAPSGAYIYLPGGGVPYSNGGIIIDKEVHIVGAGFWPDSTMSTNYSNLLGCMMELRDGSSGSSFEGFSINLFNQTEMSSNLTFTRLNIFNLIQLYPNNGIIPTGVSNILIYNCLLGGNNSGNSSFLNNASNCLVSNNIIKSEIVNIYNSSIRNNLFINANLGYNCSNSSIENNIFANTQYIDGNHSIYNNNIAGGTGVFVASNSSFSNNTDNTSPSTILTSFTPYQFSYNDNYHVLPNSIAHNGGTDGTDIGIYGGLYPWKEGAVPSNPHIRTATVSPASNGQGNIHVNIKVGAQDH